MREVLSTLREAKRSDQPGSNREADRGRYREMPSPCGTTLPKGGTVGPMWSRLRRRAIPDRAQEGLQHSANRTVLPRRWVHRLELGLNCVVLLITPFPRFPRLNPLEAPRKQAHRRFRLAKAGEPTHPCGLPASLLFTVSILFPGGSPSTRDCPAIAHIWTTHRLQCR
jgi:hypothetical protein